MIKNTSDRHSVLFRIPRNQYYIVRQLARDGYRSINQQLLMLVDEALAARNMSGLSQETNEEDRE